MFVFGDLSWEVFFILFVLFFVLLEEFIELRFLILNRFITLGFFLWLVVIGLIWLIELDFNFVKFVLENFFIEGNFEDERLDNGVCCLLWTFRRCCFSRCFL